LLPILPGPPLSYLGLLLLHLTVSVEFSTKFLISWGIITVLVSVFDYIVPILGTRYFGGSKYGIWGSVAGLLAGMFFPPLGLIIGPFMGAVAGEIIAGNKKTRLRLDSDRFWDSLREPSQRFLFPLLCSGILSQLFFE